MPNSVRLGSYKKYKRCKVCGHATMLKYDEKPYCSDCLGKVLAKEYEMLKNNEIKR